MTLCQSGAMAMRSSVSLRGKLKLISFPCIWEPWSFPSVEAKPITKGLGKQAKAGSNTHIHKRRLLT